MNQMENISQQSHFSVIVTKHILAVEYVVNELNESAWFLEFVTSPRRLPQPTTGSLLTLGVHALDHPTLALTDALAAVCDHL